jgi:glycosyltransferase involved in cell wall biosynthesis
MADGLGPGGPDRGRTPTRRGHGSGRSCARCRGGAIGIGDNRADACSPNAQALRKRFGDRRIVLALGRITHQKGFEVLIDAAASLPEDTAVPIVGAASKTSTPAR